jgi:hypothetical protein
MRPLGSNGRNRDRSRNPAVDTVMNGLRGMALVRLAVATGCSGAGAPPGAGPGRSDEGRLRAAETALLRSGSLRPLAVSGGRRAVEPRLTANCLAPDLAVVAPPCRKRTSERSPTLLRLGRTRLRLMTGGPAANVSVHPIRVDGDAVDVSDAEPVGLRQRRWAVTLAPVTGVTSMVVRVTPQRTDSGYAEFRIRSG